VFLFCVLRRYWALLAILLFAGCETPDLISREGGWSALSTLSRDRAGRATGSLATPQPEARWAAPREDATPQENASFFPGTGQFFGSGAQPKSSTGKRDSERVTVNLANAPIAQAAKTILGDILGLNYTVNPRLEGKITIQTSTPVTRSEVVELFQNALRSNGAVIVKTGALYAVEPADQVGKSASQVSAEQAGRVGSDIGFSTRVVQLTHVSASEMRRVLEPMAQKGGVLRADDARNTLTITGTGQEIGSLLNVISIFDVDVMKGMSFAIIPVRSVQPEAIVDDLRTVFSTSKEGPMSGMVKFIPNPRLRSILVISPQPSYLSQAETWVRRLDTRAQGAEKQLFTYNARNRSAKEIIAIIDSLFSSKRRTDVQAERQVAPRYQEGSVQGSSASSISQVALGVPGTGQRREDGNQSEVIAKDDPSIATPSGVKDLEEERFRLSADEGKNAVLILATRADYERIARMLESVDVITYQVLIEATIAEVSLTDDLEFGVRWFLNHKGTSFALTDAASNFFGSSFPGFSYAVAKSSVEATLNTLNKISKVNVISSPSLMVAESRTAVLQIGDQVPIVTQSAVGVVSQGAPIVNSVNYRDTGVILSITPRINESGRVLLNIEQEVSSVAATTSSGIDSPTIKQRRVKTTVTVNDGEALTLGGLIQSQTTDTRSQIPLFGDLPLLGNAFRQKSDNRGKTELIILLRPHVIRDAQDAWRVTDAAVEHYRREVDLQFRHTAAGPKQMQRTLDRALR
jgi:general secretion pathway protein D